MWSGPLPVAHGALGPLDEIFLVLVIGVFVVMFAAPTVIALVKRQSGDTAAENPADAASPAPDNTPRSLPGEPPADKNARRDHFRLD